MQLPQELGHGTVTCLTTTNGISLSGWDMCYEGDTHVSGKTGDDLCLFFCLGDGVQWQVGDRGRTQRLDSGEAWLCLGDGTKEELWYTAGSAYAFHAIRIPRGHVVAVLGRYFSETGAARVLREQDGRCFAISRDLMTALGTLPPLEEISDGFGMMRLEGKVQEILALCLQEATGEPQGLLRPDDARLVEAVKERIDRDYALSLPIASLARDVGVSPSKLTRDFKAQYGLPLHAYVIECRLCEAARLLRTGAYPVREVAERVGYVKAGQFSAAFRQRFGVSPHEY